jgi:WD40 repeat protein
VRSPPWPSISLNALTFSPDSQILASAGGDNTLRLWSLKSQVELLRLTDEDGRYNALAFSPDGSKLAGLREDGRLVVWQVIGF